ncbi:MAG: LapA family protein [Sphingomonadales bacterium]|nr:LapA family protein [Sphingomonadales bacterium]
MAVLIVVFAMFNWVPVTVRFWPGMLLDTSLPIIVAIAFLLGSLPLWIAHRVTKWKLSRRIDTTERELEIYRSTNSATADPAVAAPVEPAAPVLEQPAPTTADRDIDRPI